MFTITTSNHKGISRITRPVKGQTYKIEPINPKKRKYRGRICTFIDYDEDRIQIATVRFNDTNREGKIPVDDLVQIAITR